MPAGLARRSLRCLLLAVLTLPFLAGLTGHLGAGGVAGAAPAEFQTAGPADTPPAEVAPPAADAFRLGLDGAGEEAVSLRTRMSKTFVRDNGTYTTALFSAPVHYRDRAGRWQPIDNALVHRTGGGYENRSNDVKIEVPADLEDPVGVVLADGARIDFRLDGARGSAAIDGAAATFKEALPGVDVRYSATPDGVKEDLVLASPSAQNTFRFFVEVTGGIGARVANNGRVEFRNSQQQTVAALMPPYMVDAAGTTSTSVTAELKSVAAGFLLTLRPDRAWLLERDRKWPVTVDPTVRVGGYDGQGRPVYLDCTIASGTHVDTNYCPGSNFWAGRDYDYGPFSQRSLLAWDLSDIPTESTIVNAELRLYNAAMWVPNVARSVSVHRLTRGYTMNATWNRYDGASAWTAGGGDFVSVPVSSVTLATRYQWYSWPVTGLVQGWIDGSFPNDGMLVRAADETIEDSYVGFYSAEYTPAGYGPTLVVTYVPPEQDDPGPTEADQAPSTGSDVQTVPAAPTPMTPSGSAPAGSYTTELWSEEETAAEEGLRVVSSTNSGTFALTGVVLNDATGQPISGATVQLNNVATGTGTLATTSDTRGGFSFMNVPPRPTATGALVVSKSGFGSYEVYNTLYAVNEQYQTTVELNGTAQRYNDSVMGARAPATSGATYPTYDSYRRVPPQLRVAIYPQDAFCARVAGSSYVAKRYPWRFYILHTLVAEIDTSFPQAAVKATAAWIQNYAWAELRNPIRAPLGADVDNTTTFQCFKPERQIPRSWRTFVDDILDERIARANDTILQTPYKRGASICFGDTDHPQDGNDGSQLGAKAQVLSCGVTDWRTITHYYFTGTVRPGRVPPVPKTSFSRPGSGRIQFNFPARVTNSNVGWRYRLERNTSTGWRVIYDRGWSWVSRTVPTTHTYTPPAGCYRYRVRTSNPVGVSAYASYNGGACIGP